MEAQSIIVSGDTIKYFHDLTGYIEVDKMSRIWNGKCLFGGDEVPISLDFDYDYDEDEESISETWNEQLEIEIKEYMHVIDSLNNRYEIVIDEILSNTACYELMKQHNQSFSQTEIDDAKWLLRKDLKITKLSMESSSTVVIFYSSTIYGDCIKDQISWDIHEKRYRASWY